MKIRKPFYDGNLETGPVCFNCGKLKCVCNQKTAKEKPFIIRDWAGNLMDFGRFETWDDAEDFLSERLEEAYETDRQEYFIERDTK
jgi:hypothetical protein